MPFRKLDLVWALTATLPPLNFVLPGLLTETFGLIVAPGATGKSSLALDIAVSIALGRPVAEGLFPAAPPAKVVYLAGEESARILAERLRPLVRLDEQGAPSLYDNLFLLPMSGEACDLVSDGQATALFDELKNLAEGARLVIVDPLRRLHNGEENASSDMTSFVVAMERLAKFSGAAVLGIHHANRASTIDSASQHAARGSTALVDGARWQINLSRMDERAAEIYMVSEAERPLYVAVDFAKTNYIAARPRCWLKRKPGGGLALAKPLACKARTNGHGGARTL